MNKFDESAEALPENNLLREFDETVRRYPALAVIGGLLIGAGVAAALASHHQHDTAQQRLAHLLDDLQDELAHAAAPAARKGKAAVTEAAEVLGCEARRALKRARHLGRILPDRLRSVFG